jgi:hypothetical protein
MNLHDFSFEAQLKWLKENNFLHIFLEEKEYNIVNTIELSKLNSDNIIRIAIKHAYSGESMSWEQIGKSMQDDLMCSESYMASELEKTVRDFKIQHPEEFL